MDKARAEILFKLIDSLQVLEMAEAKLDLALYSSVRYVFNRKDKARFRKNACSQILPRISYAQN